MFDEYVFLVMETQQQQVKEQNLQTNVKRFMKNAGMPFKMLIKQNHFNDVYKLLLFI